MGKAKRRSIALGKHNQITNLTRDDAINMTIEKLSKGEDVTELVTLFGLKAEELLEAGLEYEYVKAIEGILL
ncbi:hypothetical protein J6O48_12740 [bacterium]|nr:hypothetical protein [bacterium]